MTEEEKTKEAQREASKSIEEVCSDTWEVIYRFIYSKVQNRQEAEEITQETYVKALAYLQKNNIKIDKYTAYLKTISLNIIRDKWRKNKRQGKVIDIEAITYTAIKILMQYLQSLLLISFLLALRKSTQVQSN